MTNLEETFLLQVRALKLPLPDAEYRFHPIRKWRFDFAWPSLKIAVEVEGGTWGKRGRHIRPAGFHRDCEKYNHAALLGWRVFRGDSKMVNGGELIAIIEEVLQQ